MPHDSSILFPKARPSVVATLGNAAAWHLAGALLPGAVDFLEIRADLLLEKTDALPGGICDLPFPAILTVRAAAEGGKGSPDPQTRAALYERHLAEVAAIDVELASAHALRPLLQKARENGVACILSHHNFWGTPACDILRKLSSEARQLGADLFKVATTVENASQLAALSEWLESENAHSDFPLAAMGMGKLGKISRPLLAQLGSRLNYGYLDAPVVPGQWPAPELRRFLDSLAY